MSRDVEIVGLGATVPVGHSASAAAAAVRAGISRVIEHPLMTAGGEPVRCGLVGALASSLSQPERIAALADAALADLARSTHVALSSERRVPWLLALPESRPGFSDDDVELVEEGLADQALRRGAQLERCGAGHAGALQGIERGFERIARGDWELCLVGGSDSYFDPDTFAWLDDERRIIRDGVRSGFPPGEGAAVIALASSAARKQLQLPRWARILGVASAREHRDPHAGPGLMGEGLCESLRAIEREAMRAGLIQEVYCDLNGERPRTTDWGFALLRLGHWFRDGTDYRSPVRSCGDLGAATGAFNCVLAVRAWARGYAKGPLALVWGGSWNGSRRAVLLEHGGAVDA